MPGGHVRAALFRDSGLGSRKLTATRELSRVDSVDVECSPT